MADRATAYPDGLLWRCGRCDFACGDDGPDRCPNDNAPLSRVMTAFRIDEGPEPKSGP